VRLKEHDQVYICAVTEKFSTNKTSTEVDLGAWIG